MCVVAQRSVCRGHACHRGQAGWAGCVTLRLARCQRVKAVSGSPLSPPSRGKAVCHAAIGYRSYRNQPCVIVVHVRSSFVMWWKQRMVTPSSRCWLMSLASRNWKRSEIQVFTLFLCQPSSNTDLQQKNDTAGFFYCCLWICFVSCFSLSWIQRYLRYGHAMHLLTFFTLFVHFALLVNNRLLSGLWTKWNYCWILVY